MTEKKLNLIVVYTWREALHMRPGVLGRDRGEASLCTAARLV